MTPEGRVKARIKKVLERYGVYYFMPVQSGLGASGVDFHCVVGWRGIALAFFIEAKADRAPTKRQDLFLKRRREEQNAKTFVIDDEIEIDILISWLEKLKNERQSEFRP
jgi:hypothetical protein